MKISFGKIIMSMMLILILICTSSCAWHNNANELKKTSSNLLVFSKNSRKIEKKRYPVENTKFLDLETNTKVVKKSKATIAKKQPTDIAQQETQPPKPNSGMSNFFAKIFHKQPKPITEKPIDSTANAKPHTAVATISGNTLKAHKTDKATAADKPKHVEKKLKTTPSTLHKLFKTKPTVEAKEHNNAAQKIQKSKPLPTIHDSPKPATPIAPPPPQNNNSKLKESLEKDLHVLQKELTQPPHTTPTIQAEPVKVINTKPQPPIIPPAPSVNPLPPLESTPREALKLPPNATPDAPVTPIIAPKIELPLTPHAPEPKAQTTIQAESVKVINTKPQPPIIPPAPSVNPLPPLESTPREALKLPPNATPAAPVTPIIAPKIELPLTPHAPEPKAQTTNHMPESLPLPPALPAMPPKMSQHKSSNQVIMEIQPAAQMLSITPPISINRYAQPSQNRVDNASEISEYDENDTYR